MRTDAEPDSDELSRHTRRRQAVVVILRSFLVTAAVVVAYFVLPFTSPLAMDTVLEIFGGLTLLSAFVAWQVLRIVRSPFPAVHAISALLMVVPLFLTLFATAYYAMSYTDPGNFTEALTKLDAMYFTVTTFATVGFGDIAAKSEVARAVVTVQMVAGLVLVGFIARVVVAAVQEARNRDAAEPRR